MANVGSENFSKNVPSALFGLAVYVTIILLTLYLDWQLVGLAAAVFLRRFTEAMLRLIPVIRSMMKAPKCTTSPDLMPRVLSFSGQAFAITLLTLVVWDRSEVLFLKHFADVRQLAYYSVGFSLTEYILMIPTVLGGALGAALMAEYSRSREGVQTLTSNAIRHLSLVILPVHVGVAVVSAAVIPLAYGPAYHAAAPVLATAAILAIPKGFYWLPMTVFQATERQTTTVRWLVATAVVNISLDFLLIPRFGAMGAAIANGFSQCFAVCGMWYSASKIVYVRPPWSSVIRLVMAALVMGAVAFAIVYSLPPVPAICCAIPAGVVTYVLLVRQFRVLDAADILPLGKIAKRLPGPAARIVVRLSRFMAPAANATQTAAYRAAAGT
jgi:O-antigen/teichoic acid export membrane protein